MRWKKGAPNSLVKIKVKRPLKSGMVDMDVSLIRELGNEHVLTYKHQGRSVFFCSLEVKQMRG